MKKSIGSGRGSVYNILLKSLQTGDKYGYEICKEVEEKTNGTYILKQASLYSGLKRLEAQGDITSYWRDSALGGRRHYYSLTEKGRNRIERSNFSWTDARDDIVDSLFEKSAFQQAIDDVTTDISSLKKVTSSSDEQTIEEIIEKTNNLVENKSKTDGNIAISEVVENENNQPENETEKENYSNSYSQGDDLFSMFSSYSIDNNKNDEENTHETNETLNEEKDDTFEKEAELTDNLVDKILTSQEETSQEVEQKSFVENDKISNEVKDELAETSNEYNSTAQLYGQQSITNNSVNDETYSQNKQMDLFSFMSSDNKEVDYFQKHEENDETKKDDLSDVLSNLQTVENTESVEQVDESAEIDLTEHISLKTEVIENNENVEKFATLQKTESNVFDDYMKSHVISSFGKFSESTQFEKPESVFSDFSSSFFDQQEELEDLHQPTQNDGENAQQDAINQSVTDIENVQNETEDYHALKSNECEENHDNAEQNIHQSINEESSSATPHKSFDYRDIFGDLMSVDKKTDENDNIVQNENYQQYIDTNAQFDVENEKSNSNMVEGNEQQTKEDAELPRIEPTRDVNVTLFVDKSKTETPQPEHYSKTDYGFEKYDQSPFETDGRNPFEKYDAYTTPEAFDASNEIRVEQQVNVQAYNQKIKDLSFDKKYANDNNNFEVPDYEVRYHRKSNEKAVSRFVSINKLNLAASSILCVLVYLLSTIILFAVTSSIKLSAFQTSCFVASYVVGVALLMFDFVKYLLNRNKKSQNIPDDERFKNIAIAVIVLVLSVCANIASGMQFSNILHYSGSFFLPVVYSIAILVRFRLKKYLSTFKNFYL